jgi:hypothetical protein
VDQAFAPGTSDFDVLAREALKLRRPDGQTAPTTEVLTTSGTLESFMQELVTSVVRVPRPVPEIILLSHASESGWLEMALTNDERNEIQYEALTRVGTALNIPEQVLTDAVGNVKPAVVRIRGCRIGIARKFLGGLKQALKNASKIVAPKHYQAASTWNDESGKLVARLEFLMYCFESYPTRPVDVSDKAPKTTATQDVINTLKADLHLRVDGTPVPDDQWGKWLSKAGIGKKVEVSRKYPATIPIRMPPAWHVSPDEGDLAGAFAFEHEIMTNNGPWEIGKGPTAGDAAARRAFVKSKLRDPASKTKFAFCFEGHPWPIWERYLKVRYETFTSFDDFMEGFDWVFQVGSWYGMRHVYRMLVPITLPVNTNILVANYYPVAAQPAHIGLIETDGAYFASL